MRPPAPPEEQVEEPKDTLRTAAEVHFWILNRENLHSIVDALVNQHGADAVIGAIPSNQRPLTFDEVTEINRQRCTWLHRHETSPWNGADWSNAMQGEAGEAGNVVKKLRRIETGTQAPGDPLEVELLLDLAFEIADTYMYLDLLATYYGVDIPVAVAMKFNEVSEKRGANELLRQLDRPVLREGNHFHG